MKASAVFIIAVVFVILLIIQFGFNKLVFQQILDFGESIIHRILEAINAN